MDLLVQCQSCREFCSTNKVEHPGWHPVVYHSNASLLIEVLAIFLTVCMSPQYSVDLVGFRCRMICIYCKLWIGCICFFYAVLISGGKHIAYFTCFCVKFNFLYSNIRRRNEKRQRKVKANRVSQYTELSKKRTENLFYMHSTPWMIRV